MDKSHFRPSSSSARGLTIVELLVLITIVLVVAVLAAGVGSLVQRRMAVEKARAQLHLLDAELTSYQRDHGLPDKEDQCGMTVYSMLYGDGVGEDGVACTADDMSRDGRPDPGARIYLAELDPGSDTFDLVDPSGAEATPTKLLDPFGNSWRFRSGSLAVRNPQFDLWSAGPDGLDGTADDIQNW